MKKAKEPNVLFINSKELISLFLKEGISINWGKEIKIAKKLLTEYSDIKFWKFLDTATRFTSLAWFLTSDGKQFLKKQYEKYSLDFEKKNSYTIEKENLIEVKAQSKPTNVLEFLKT